MVEMAKSFLRDMYQLQITGVNLIIKKGKNILTSQNGLATVETVPMLIVFLIFVGYGIGSFGIVHTGILNSIAARTYAFETFRHRANVRYFRDELTPGAGAEYYANTRLHTIQSEAAQLGRDDYGIATERGIVRGLTMQEKGRTEDQHIELDEVFQQFEFQYTGKGVQPAWIKTQYGICLNAGCGD